MSSTTAASTRPNGSSVASWNSSRPNKFAEIAWLQGPEGSPLVDYFSAMIEAEFRERFQAKTHTILFCRVRHAEVTDIGSKVYKAGRFYNGANLESLERDGHREFLDRDDETVPLHY